MMRLRIIALSIELKELSLRFVITLALGIPAQPEQIRECQAGTPAEPGIVHRQCVSGVVG